jgi:hypothetical protein
MEVSVSPSKAEFTMLIDEGNTFNFPVFDEITPL